MSEMLAPLASVLTECVPFQAQSLARSLQAELEKLRLAEHAAASDKEEAQHLKVSCLCHNSKVTSEQDYGHNQSFLRIGEQGLWLVCRRGLRAPLWLKDSRATATASLHAEISVMP